MTGVPLFVINLDRSTERLASISAEFRRLQLEFHRVAAVDARLLAAEDFAEAYDPRGGRDCHLSELHRGEIACFLSHREAWRQFLASGALFGAVFEDDAIPSPLLPGVLDALSARPVAWDVIKLYGSSTEISAKVAELTGATDLVRPWVVSLSAAAYCISRRGAEKLLAGTMPFRRPVDVELQRWWEHRLDLLAVRPAVASVAHAGESTIRPHREHRWTERMRREVRRPIARVRVAARSVAERWRERPTAP